MNNATNVVYMNMQAEYVAPDLAAMTTSINKIHNSMAIVNLSFEKSNYLPSLVNKFSGWTTAIVKGRQTLGESCQNMAIDFDLAVQKLHGLSAEYTESDDLDEQLDILDEIKSVLFRVIGNTSNEAKKLKSALSDFNGAFDVTATTQYLAGFNVELERLLPVTDELKEQLQVLSDQRNVLTDAIDALASSGVADAAKDSILTVEKMIQLGLQPPQMAIVELALDQLKKMIDNAKATFTYLGLVSERDALRRKLDTLASKIADSAVKIGSINTTVSLIEAIHTLDENRAVVVTEFKHVVESVDLFLKLNSTPVEDGDALRLTDYAIQLSAYLQDIK